LKFKDILIKYEFSSTEVVMDISEFSAYLGSQDVDISLLVNSRPKLVECMAGAWRWTHVFGRILDRSLLGQVDGRILTDVECVIVRQIGHAHKMYRSRLAKMAAGDLLKKIGEDRLPLIERDQMPVTAAMAAKFKEINVLLAADNLGALTLMRSNAIDFNQKDRDGLTALAMAAQLGSDKCLFALCKNLANPHVADVMGNTPLHWACTMNHAKVLSVLLYHGANPNAPSNNGVTPLMLGVAKGNKEVIQKLLEYGADLRMHDRKGNSVLHRAILMRNRSMAEFLVSSGCFIDEKNGDGVTPVGLAMRMPEMIGLFEHV
jgi:ankyrin repeat protein